MKAIVYYGPGNVRVAAVPEPGKPRPGEVVLRMRRGSMCGTDASQYQKASMIPLDAPHPVSGHQGPVILGHEGVGTIVRLGEGCTRFQPGQRVVPGAGMWCGVCASCLAGYPNICRDYFLYGIHAHGCLAELATFPEKMCVPVPDACSDDAATLAQPLAVALHALNRVHIQPGMLIAFWGVGNIGRLMLAALQARNIGNVRIIAIDTEPARLKTAEALGATYLIHAATQNPQNSIARISNGTGVPLVVNATGSAEVVSMAFDVLAPGGTLLQVGIPHPYVSLDLGQAVVQEKKLLTTNGQICTKDLPEALDILTQSDIATKIGYKLIKFEACVEQGLLPLVKHEATQKGIVCIEQ